MKKMILLVALFGAVSSCFGTKSGGAQTSSKVGRKIKVYDALIIGGALDAVPQLMADRADIKRLDAQHVSEMKRTVPRKLYDWCVHGILEMWDGFFAVGMAFSRPNDPKVGKVVAFGALLTQFADLITKTVTYNSFHLAGKDREAYVRGLKDLSGHEREEFAALKQGLRSNAVSCALFKASGGVALYANTKGPELNISTYFLINMIRRFYSMSMRYQQSKWIKKMVARGHALAADA